MGEPFQFSKAGRNILAALIYSMIGDAVALEGKPSPEEVAIEIEGMIRLLPPLQRTGFAWAIRVFEMSPLISGFRHSFSRLKPEERLKYLSEFEQAENYLQRALILLMKTPVFLYYFSHPAIEAAIGYDHHCLLASPPRSESP